MTTYIGRIGDMIPTPSIREVSSDLEQRVIFGGGEGTLSPRRARVYGAGARTWQMTRDGWYPGENSVLDSLARTQARYGGSYRVITDAAVDHNMLTPQASEDLQGWLNVTPGWRAAFPDLEVGSSVIPLTIPFVIGGTGTLSALDPRPSSLGKILAGQTGVSPHVPAVKAGPVHAYTWVSGSGTLRLRVWDESGSSSIVTQAFTGTAGVLVRVGVTATLAPTAASMQIEVVAGAADIYLAWPSLAHREVPYLTGRGCDAALISVSSRTALTDDVEDIVYTISEVGV